MVSIMSPHGYAVGLCIASEEGNESSYDFSWLFEKVIKPGVSWVLKVREIPIRDAPVPWRRTFHDAERKARRSQVLVLILVWVIREQHRFCPREYDDEEVWVNGEGVIWRMFFAHFVGSHSHFTEPYAIEWWLNGDLWSDVIRFARLVQRIQRKESWRNELEGEEGSGHLDNASSFSTYSYRCHP